MKSHSARDHLNLSAETYGSEVRLNLDYPKRRSERYIRERGLS